MYFANLKGGSCVLSTNQTVRTQSKFPIYAFILVKFLILPQTFPKKQKQKPHSILAPDQHSMKWN